MVRGGLVGGTTPTLQGCALFPVEPGERLQEVSLLPGVAPVETDVMAERWYRDVRWRLAGPAQGAQSMRYPTEGDRQDPRHRATPVGVEACRGPPHLKVGLVRDLCGQGRRPQDPHGKSVHA